jgi:predicted thioesterase
MDTLQVGLKWTKTEVVNGGNMASAAGSGTVGAYATPSLILLMEIACKECVMPYLEEGMVTVGSSLQVDHIAATPEGMKVTCNCELIEVDRKRLLFKVEAFDEVEQIARGTHERYIVNQDKFEARCNAKKK